MNCRSSNSRPTWSGLLLFAALSFAATACGDSEGPVDTGVVVDTGVRPDASGPNDTGIHPDAAGPTDTGIHADAAIDSGVDAGVDTGVDAGPTDTGTTATDGGMPDGGGLDGSVTSSCGDNLAELAEVCDGTDLRNTTCESLGFQAGTLACASDCSTFDLTGCPGAPVCGDDTAEGNEACDGTDLRALDCTDVGFAAGTLACNANCTFDTAACTAAPGCGDGAVTGDEVCDDGNTNLGDGCDAACLPEWPYICSGAPSICTLPTTIGPISIGLTVNVNGGPLAAGDYIIYFITVTEDLLLSGTLTSTPGDGDFYFFPAAGPPAVFNTADVGDESWTEVAITAGDYAVLIQAYPDNGPITSFALSLVGSAQICGNGTVEGTETCDDGNTTPGDGCSDTCTAEVPGTWTCDPIYFADGACDCGCGAQDVDCASNTDPAACEFCEDCAGTIFADCTLWIDPADNTMCVVPVCGNGTVEGTETCDDGNTTPGDGCSDNCTIEVAVGWTCDPAYYGDGDCDCGCAVLDIDCADATVASCLYCSNVGSCNTGAGCPGTIDPANNAICVAPTCGDSTIGVGEQCDDGNTTPGDGCDANCQLEPGDIDVSATPALAIPDNDPNGVTTTLNVPAAPACVLASTRVAMDITHTWRGDLIVDLTSPAGTTVRLHDRAGGSADDIVGIYGADLIPAEPLTAFDGQDPAGDWTLFMSDSAGSDTGTLNSWGLTLICQ